MQILTINLCLFSLYVKISLDSIAHILPISGQNVGNEVISMSAHRGNKVLLLVRRGKRKSNKALHRSAKGAGGGTARHRSKLDPKPTRNKRKRK